MKRMRSSFKLIIVILLVAGCSANSTYNRANGLYEKGNYVAAIQFYDQFLQKKGQGISSAYALFERSDCYYQLGMKAYERENWMLAQRLFFLANSEIADEKLDNCYYYLAEADLAQGNEDKALEFYNYVLENLTNSELTPKILISRIKLNDKKGNEAEILRDYKNLYLNYPECDTNSYVNDKIDSIITTKAKKLMQELAENNHEETLEELLILENYPTTHLELIKQDIATVHLFKSDILLEQKDYGEVVVNLQKALEYDPTLNSVIEDKLEQTFEFFISHGYQLSSELKFDEAIAVLKQCLSIYPEYLPAQEARENVQTQKWNYLESQELMEQAQVKEEAEDYQEALRLYEKADYHYDSQELQNKIFIMKNLLKAEKEPRKFALELVQNYKSGKILKAINNLENDLKTRYDENLIVSSEWDVQYSTGNYKYEVRYDILTPEENYYFVWLTDLKKGIISPLNKISEELM